MIIERLEQLKTWVARHEKGYAQTIRRRDATFGVSKPCVFCNADAASGIVFSWFDQWAITPICNRCCEPLLAITSPKRGRYIPIMKLHFAIQAPWLEERQAS